MENAKLPAPNKGHVLLGDHAPVLIYQVSPGETRVLCAFRSAKPPSAAKNEIYNYLQKTYYQSYLKNCILVLNKLSRRRNLESCLINISLLKAKSTWIDLTWRLIKYEASINWGGMTVGLNDAVLLARLLDPKSVEDLDDYDLIQEKLTIFHRKRKNLDAVINTLSIALYSLFAADKTIENFTTWMF